MVNIIMIMGVVLTVAQLAYGIISEEMEQAARGRRVARNFDRMARAIEGWRR